MLNLLAVVLSCCGDGGTVAPGPWAPSSGGSSDGGSCSSCSPIGAQYWTGAADGTLTAEKNLGALSTGLVKNTGGVPSQYAGTSCTNQFPRSLDNSGAATCASVSLTADVSGTLPETNGGTGAGALTCTSGQALTSNGSAYSCTSTLTASSVSGSNVSGAVATATALAANPADCSSGQYANAIAATGDLTCSAVATSQLSGTITNAQLASLYSGVGACGSHQWASTLISNSAPTCTQPGYSDLSGCDPGQGVAGAVQYNASSCEGGITNLTSDGTNPIVTGIATHPATPTANIVHYDFRPSAAFPGFPFARDSFTGTPIPLGVLDSFSGGLGFSNWMWQCTKKPSAGALVTVFGNAPTATNWSSTPGQALASTTLVSRIPWMTGITTTGFQAVALTQDQPTTLSGNGFIWWARVNLSQTTTRAAWFFGLSSTNTVFTTAAPSSLLGTIYFGCDGNGGGTQANLHICSNDDTGSATCTDLGSSFPCRNNDTIYDLWLASAPGYALPDGGLGASYYVSNLDAGLSAAGTTSNDLPDSGQGMRWYLEGNQGDAGSPNVITAGFNTTCLANNL